MLQVFFWYGHQQYVFFCSALSTPGVAANSSVTMVGATPYKLFLKVSGVNKQLAISDFTFRKR
jgi:hypothetical protein